MAPIRLFLAAILVAGCAHTESNADRQFAEMRAQVDDMTAEQDKATERLDVETASDERALRTTPPLPKKAAGPATSERPLRAVQLGEGDDSGESDDPNDPTARPEIKLQGSPGSVAVPRHTDDSAAPPPAKRPRRRNTDPADDRAPKETR